MSSKSYNNRILGLIELNSNNKNKNKNKAHKHILYFYSNFKELLQNYKEEKKSCINNFMFGLSTNHHNNESVTVANNFKYGSLIVF